jgi:riboflavin biosynthesis pyrimidine reductase
VYPLRKATQLTVNDQADDLDDNALATLYAYPGVAAGAVRVRANMISSIDGMAAMAGTSGALGADGDRKLFSVLRALADVIVVGARTAVAEGYGPVQPHPALSDRRVADGRAPTAALALVSNTLTFPVPSDGDVLLAPGTVIVTCRSADDAARRRLRDAGATLVDCGEETVDPHQMFEYLAGRGLWRVLCEGGPALLGALLDRDLVDELCLTTSPLLTAGAGKHITTGADAVRTMRRAHVLADDEDYLYTRWVRDQR